MSRIRTLLLTKNRPLYCADLRSKCFGVGICPGQFSDSLHRGIGAGEFQVGEVRVIEILGLEAIARSADDDAHGPRLGSGQPVGNLEGEMIRAAVKRRGRVNQIRRGAGERAVGRLGHVGEGDRAARRNTGQGDGLRAGGGDDLRGGHGEAEVLGRCGDRVFNGGGGVGEAPSTR